MKSAIIPSSKPQSVVEPRSMRKESGRVAEWSEVYLKFRAFQTPASHNVFPSARKKNR